MSGIRGSEEELRTVRGMQSAFFDRFDKAIQVLAEANQWSETAATKAIVDQFMSGKNPVEILANVLEHKRLD